MTELEKLKAARDAAVDAAYAAWKADRNTAITARAAIAARAAYDAALAAQTKETDRC